jgi:hypothetical protein
MRPVPFLDAPDTKAESGNLIVKENPVILAGLETKRRDDLLSQPERLH